MDNLRASKLESLLKFPGTPAQVVVSDASVLSCGCLVSESLFLSSCSTQCPNCNSNEVHLLAEVKPLRELYVIVQLMLNNFSRPRRLSSKKSIRGGESGSFNDEASKESQDLISLFYKYAKEVDLVETKLSNEGTVTGPIDISNAVTSQRTNLPSNSPPCASSILSQSPFNSLPPKDNKANFEKNLIQSLSEEKEYNFSKCFPLYRHLSSFSTQQNKFNLNSFANLSFKLNSMIKKTIRFMGSSIYSYFDFDLNVEITNFVLITNKRWELYEFIPTGRNDVVFNKPRLICCGKLTGEYGPSYNSMTSNKRDDIVLMYDFSNGSSGRQESNEEIVNKRLNQWEFLHCSLGHKYLVISGTKGIMRVFNTNKNSTYDLGQPIYTYLINFPIRCMSISRNESLIACGITAKERISGKEQPFIILNNLILSSSGKLESVDPITITIPYRDPIKLLNFNSSATHLICFTAWESRYLIIKLRGNNTDNYRKPRLIWSDTLHSKTQRRYDNDESESVNTDDDFMMTDEGVTDIQFGSLNSNALIFSYCTLHNKLPFILRLHGATIDTKKKPTENDGYSLISGLNSIEEEKFNNITSSEVIMRIPEVGSSIHRFALSPRGDGIVFLTKEGSLYLLSTSDWQAYSAMPSKKLLVHLGEVSATERSSESASVMFSSDGGQIFTVDRKGIFNVFDFTKGVPGADLDVVKCKIINL